MYRALRASQSLKFSGEKALFVSRCFSATPPKGSNDTSRSPSQQRDAHPKGFEEFYAKKFVKDLPVRNSAKESITNALRLQRHEEVLIVELLARRRHKKIGKTIFFVATCFSFYILYFKFIRHSHDFKADVSKYQHMVVSVTKHLALYFSDEKKEIGARQFIDYLALESSSDPSKDIIVDFSTYYPWVPMMLLCLLPMLAIINSKFNGLVSVSSDSLLANKGRFRFKRDTAVKTRLSDVAGLTEAKHELLEVIDFLTRPEKYTALGAKLPKGVLLDGPPGVGKTLLAKAVAGEAQVPFVSCSGSEFDEVYVGVGASRVRELFREAHKCKPCVVFIDEIDSFGRKRKSDGQGSSRGTLNAFLSELDGFKDSSGILVLGATNRADILDNAMTRSGRFDRKITLDKPAYKDRVAIALVHLRPLRLDSSSTRESYAECIAALTPGCSGADIYNVCNEGAVNAAREGKEFVALDDFHKSAERVLIGLQKSAVTYQPHERERLAYHEAGVVVLHWFQNLTDPVIKTTILPRGGHRTGITQMLPQSVYISTEERLRESIVGTLGGYVAEVMFFNDVSTRGAEKLEKATNMARQMICTYGMDPTGVGHMGFQIDSGAIQKPYGPKKEDAIDQSVEKIMADSFVRAKELLKENFFKVQVVAGLLLKQETLSAYDLWLVLGDRPTMSKEFRTYLLS